MNSQPILIKPLAINGLLPEEKSLPAKRTEKKFGAVPDNTLNVLSEAVCKRVD